LYDEAGRRVSRRVTLSIDDLDAGDVVIRSRYAAVNYKDARAVCGIGNVVTRFPCIPGVEVSGTVVASQDERFRAGDVVVVQGGREFGSRRDGAFSQYVRVPGAWVRPIGAGFDAFDAIALGIAALTAALAIERLIALGVTPDKGPIVVTGATGGCSSFAIDMLARLGYRVVAITGKLGESGYLRSIGAADVRSREAIATGPKALEEQAWAGCIDAVGGAPLDAVLRSMRKGGVVCAFGNAAGETLETSVYPFILRGVTLAGINANESMTARDATWQRLARDLRPRHLERIVQRVPFAELLPYCERVVQGGIRGRGVVAFD
jgi:putative YhdH/YhfP family quinone oxidoreductase